jgi:hypothetical protein
LANFYKIIKYRKFLNKQQKSKFELFNKKYLLVCDFNNFNGLGLKLLKLFLFKNNFKFKLYKYLLSNFYINKKLTNSYLIYFKFNKFNNIIKFIEFLKNFTMIPFFCFPLFIINKLKNILLPINHINLKNSLYKLNKVNLIKLIVLKFIKNLLINYIIKLLIKLKKCQH